MYSRESLKRTLRENFEGYGFAIVANREPYIHELDSKGKVKASKTIGGVSTTFDIIMRATNGTWVAHGSGTADRQMVDKNDHIMVPTSDPKYCLRRVWMTDDEMRGYYEGLSNETLWPLCHIAFIEPKFSYEDWQTYKEINKRFADAVLEEIKGKKAVIWIQDYHFALLAKYIKEKRPDVIVAMFWHIPWPTFEIFRICPWAKEILKGMLANDLIGFHRYYQVNNFMEGVARELESKVDRGEFTIEHDKQLTKVGAFPISVDYEELAREAKNLKEADLSKYIPFDYKYLAIGVDRVDYTKGIPNRLRAIESFLEKYPKYRGKFVYLGIGSPSRSGIDAYQDLGEKIRVEVERINNKFAKGRWKPIVYVNETVSRSELITIYKKANVCLVTPLDDGMNLVCKEYVAVNEGHGALLLSSFVGAAKDLTDAYLINPYDEMGMAKTLKTALEAKDNVKKMTKMKGTVKDRNIYRWASKFISELATFKSERKG